MTKGFRKGLLGLSLGLSLCAGGAYAAAPDQTWTRSYNSQGLVATFDGPRTDVSDVTSYTYDAQGHLATVTDALGHVTTYGNYDSYSKPGQITDANGVVTLITYTPQEWPASLTRDSTGTPSTTTFTYDAAGDVTQTQDADGVLLKYTYDDARRLTDITDSAGSHIHYTLDAAGNRTKEQTFDPSNTLMHTVSRSFTSLSQLLTVTDALNRTVLTYSYPDGYDASGHPTHSADAAGTQRTLGYDALDRLVTTIDNANGTDTATQNTRTISSYDSSDNLTGVTDPSNLATTYAYDGLGNLAALHSPDTGTSSYTYDAAGNRIQQTDAKGTVTSYTYDALNRLTTVSYPDSSQNISYHYDEANSVTGCPSTSAPIGRLTRIVEANVTTVFCRDALGNLIERDQTTASGTDYTEMTYTPAGRLSSRIYPDGANASYSRNANGQISAIDLSPPHHGGSPAVSNISYLPFGPISSYTLGSGQTITRSYDANYRLTDLTSPALNLHYARDAMGNITAQGDAPGAASPTETYSYDPLYRLTQVSAGGTAQESVTYNATGDRTSKAGGGLATGSYGYQANTHWLTSTGNAARAYDANGNTTGASQAGQTFGYGYNQRNRMTVVQAGGSTVGTYTYNALGERIQKTVGATSTRFIYDDDQHLLTAEATGDGTRDYVWLDGLPVAVIDSVNGGAQGLGYVTADALGTPRVVSTSWGSTAWQWPNTGNAFGELQPTSTTGYVFNLRYPGQYYDAESGLVSNGFRTYDSTTGRYIQSDPTGLGGGISTYSYVGANPLLTVDSLGLAGGGPPAEELEVPGETPGESALNTPETNAQIRQLNQQEAEEAYERKAEQDAANGTAAQRRLIMPASEYTLECHRGDLDNQETVGAPNSSTNLYEKYTTGSGGRWGGVATRAQNVSIADHLRSLNYEITGGAGYDSEEWIPGEKGTYVDITAELNGQTVRVQTVSTYADGVTPTASESAAAGRIQTAFPNDPLFLIPKGSPTLPKP